MFDSPPDLFSLVIAIAALIFARKAYVDASRLRARLDAMEARAPARATTMAPTPPPLPAEAAPEIAPQAPPIAAEWTPVSETAAPLGAQSDAAPHAAAAAPPPPLPPAEPGFEERIGTQWVVWIGGLALALGGFF